MIVVQEKKKINFREDNVIELSKADLRKYAGFPVREAIYFPTANKNHDAEITIANGTILFYGSMFCIKSSMKNYNIGIQISYIDSVFQEEQNNGKISRMAIVTKSKGKLELTF